MALDPLLLDILACPEDRDRCTTRGQELALQPAAAPPLRDPRRDPVHADRRAETVSDADHERLREVATAGLKPTFEAP